MYKLNSVLDENSTAGVMLKALLVYNGNPSLPEALTYLAYLGAVVRGLPWTRRKQTAAAAHAVA